MDRLQSIPPSEILLEESLVSMTRSKESGPIDLIIAAALLAICLSPACYAADLAIKMVPIPDQDYEIGQYEVTQGQWKAIMGNNPSRFSECGDNCPVENVSWFGVQEFIQKLNAKTGKQYRLPTEDEWVFACHGGSENDYCGGDNPGEVGWYEQNSGGKVHGVGFKKPNGYGLYDMSGNVQEWCQDWYDSQQKVLRGGSWFNTAQDTRAAHYIINVPADRSGFTVGFRLARTLP